MCGVDEAVTPKSSGETCRALQDHTKMEAFRRRAIEWGERNLRVFRWRSGDLDAFGVLITEILLVRTRAESVEKIISQFLAEFPDAKTLSLEKPESVWRLLKPLGLHRKRAKALVELSKALVKHHGASVPADINLLMNLPYVGRYTANAVLCFAFNQKRPIVDVNVARLLQRCFGLQPRMGKLSQDEAYWILADNLLPEKDIKIYNWALLDIASLVCLRSKPLHQQCPFSAFCRFINAA